MGKDFEIVQELFKGFHIDNSIEILEFYDLSTFNEGQRRASTQGGLSPRQRFFPHGSPPSMAHMSSRSAASDASGHLHWDAAMRSRPSRVEEAMDGGAMMESSHTVVSIENGKSKQITTLKRTVNGVTTTEIIEDGVAVPSGQLVPQIPATAPLAPSQATINILRPISDFFISMSNLFGRGER